MKTTVDVLIPTYRRPSALAITLTALSAQTYRDFRVFISDQTEDEDVVLFGEVQAAIRLLRAHGHEVNTAKHLPRKGLAEQRQFLLDNSSAPYVLFLDDDLILEPFVIASLMAALTKAQCGFVGQAPIGLSFVDDVRPHQQGIEFWNGPVEPETIRPDTPSWARHHLHSAANIFHVQTRLHLSPETPRLYKIAWVGGCVLFDAAKLRATGGYTFWRDLPANHCGEDVLAQTRVMAKFGGCGVIPSGVYHLELPTTVEDRRINAPQYLDISPSPGDACA